jgi:hypothetical protein
MSADWNPARRQAQGKLFAGMTGVPKAVPIRNGTNTANVSQRANRALLLRKLTHVVEVCPRWGVLKHAQNALTSSLAYAYFCGLSLEENR